MKIHGDLKSGNGLKVGGRLVLSKGNERRPAMTHPRITSDPKVMSGKPVIKGTRIPVATILAWLGKGETIETLLQEYPSLVRDDILAAQLYAAERLSDAPLVAAE